MSGLVIGVIADWGDEKVVGGEDVAAEGNDSERVGIASGTGATGVNSWWLCSSTMMSIGAFTGSSMWLRNWVSGTDGAPAGLGQSSAEVGT